MIRRSILMSLSVLLVSAGLMAQNGAANQTETSAAPPVVAPAAADPIIETLQQALATLQASAGTEEADKTQAVGLYTEAIEARRRAIDLAARARELSQQTENAPAQLASIREELARPASSPSPEVSPDATLAQIEAQQAQAAAEVKAARDQLAELQTESTRRQDRRSAIPDQLAQARQKVADIDQQLASLGSAEATGAVSAARRALLEQQKAALEQEIRANEQEIASYEARRDLLPARRDKALRQVEEKEKLVAFWQERVGEKRQAEAVRAARDAEKLRREAARQHPVLREQAEINERYAMKRASSDGVPGRINRAADQLAKTRSELVDLRKRYASLSKRVEVSGLNRATGLLLRRELGKLEDTSTLHRQLESAQSALEDAEYTLIERQEEQVGVGDIDRVVSAWMAEIDMPATEQGRAELEAVTRELAVARRDLANTRVNDAATYFETLAELTAELSQRLDATREFNSYIEERILWVRSIDGTRVSVGEGLQDAAAWFTDRDAWSTAMKSITERSAIDWSLGAIMVLIPVLLTLVRVRARARIRAIASHVSSYRSDAYEYTLGVVALTALAALRTPSVLWAVGWFLAESDLEQNPAYAAGVGLQTAGLILLPFSFAVVALKPRGLADAHFRWPSEAVASIRRHLRWLLAVGVPVVIIGRTMDVAGEELITASLGRVNLSVGLLALAVALQRIFRPGGPVMMQIVAASGGGWASRLRYAWYPAMIGIPVALVAASWFGYHYTAVQLERRFVASLILMIVVVLLHGVLLRWLFIARRRVAVEDARRRREQAIEEEKARAGQPRGKGAAPAPQSEASAPPVDEDKLDLPAISGQTRQLFSATLAVSVLLGLFLIWADVLPALRVLDRVQVYPEIRVVETDRAADVDVLAANTPEVVPPNGTNGTGEKNASQQSLALTPGLAPVTDQPEQASALDEELTITLANIGFAIVALIVTYICFMNIPGLMEIVLLQRLPLDAGSRYALGTVLRYIIASVGLVIVFNSIGLSWSNVQWLAAALTFGLAFGLQEIFANFVSGLIILAERPIRLGDTVTVGATTGTVTRIKMRATTITDWDRKEMVIPNKTFITSDVINWTLGDTILRVTIPVGVSYGSDVDLVERTLRKVANKVKMVMNKPAPQIIFRSFADSTLNFELRVYIPSLDHIPSIYHVMHMEIIKAFRKEGIEIAFPQRDLNIRSSDIVFKHAQASEGGQPIASAEPADES